MLMRACVSVSLQSLIKSCKVDHGFSGITDVTQVPPRHDNLQQSFFLAETLYELTHTLS
jgi:hypothetical protein